MVQNKPVPNRPELAYRGTPDHPDIKIFVSHRIDMDHVATVDGPVHIPVRCGAVYDTHEHVEMLGDDTGDHISEKRGSFCELTVQYWAWKNVEADYYGLCHYRRYFSFSPKTYRTNGTAQIVESMLHDHTIRKYHLADEERIIEEVSPYDIILHTESDVTQYDTHPTSVWDLWEKYHDMLIKKETLNLLMEIIAEKAPDYYDSAKDYFAQKKFRGCNCYIMKKAVFQELCEFEFPILFELEKRLDTTGYSQQLLRTPAYMGEILGDIFMWKAIHEGKYRVSERQLVFFGCVTNESTVLAEYCLFWGRKLTDRFFPAGSKRRMFVKQLSYRVLGKKI